MALRLDFKKIDISQACSRKFFQLLFSITPWHYQSRIIKLGDKLCIFRKVSKFTGNFLFVEHHATYKPIFINVFIATNF